MAAARPLVQVYGGDGKVSGQVVTPDVFNAPIRNDIVQFVQSNIRKNRRVPYSVAKWAGTQTSAESWGTGRAVARIPRVPGGGTHRAGQGAFGNMCRGGRMFAPTRTWRRWHRKVNVNQKRFAVASALAASAIPALVMARGHQISGIPEVPLVVKTEDVENLTKTKTALALLTKLHAETDVERCKKVTKHAGKARLRNRAKKIKVGPLIITGNKGATAYRAFRNLAGVQTASVADLNILFLAPGGHVGRFIIWSQAAFEQLNTIYGTFEKPSQVKLNYHIPRPLLVNADVRRIIGSETVQAASRARKHNPVKRSAKPNYLTNRRGMAKINPFHLVHANRLANTLSNKAALKKKKNAAHGKKPRKEQRAIRKAQRKERLSAKKLLRKQTAVYRKAISV